VVNDHVLKKAYPGFVTGKLSDFAGMMFFPLLLAAACEQIGIRRGMTAVVAATIATGLVFASIKLSPSAGEVYRIVLAALQWPFRAGFAVLVGDPVPAMGHARLVADRTDLIALVALAVPVTLARQADRVSQRVASRMWWCSSMDSAATAASRASRSRTRAAAGRAASGSGASVRAHQSSRGA